MSNIIKARDLLARSSAIRSEAVKLLREADALQAQAVRLMHRTSPVRHARRVRVKITAEMKDYMRKLAKDPSLTMHDISHIVGVRNGGRVSEVLHPKKGNGHAQTL